MSIKNINTIEHLSYTGDSRSLQTLSDIYIKQALANLGQRFSLPGEGISQHKTGLWELFKTCPQPSDELFAEGGDLYSAYIKGTAVPDNEGQARYYLSVYNVGEQGLYKQIELQENDSLVLQEDVYVTGEKPKSASSKYVSYISKGSSIIKNDSQLKFGGELEDNAHNGIEILLEQYDSNDPYIYDGLRVYNDDSSYTHATHIQWIDQGSQKGYYSVVQYVSGADVYDEIRDIMMDPDNGVIRNQNWTPSDAFGWIAGHFSTTGEYTATIDKDTQLLSLDTDGDDYAEAAVLSFNNDITILMPFLRQYFNEEAYFSSDDNLKLPARIVAETIAKLRDDYIRNSEADNASLSVFDVYMPYDYELVYTCNSQNTAQIFQSVSSITVETCPDPKSMLWKLSECGSERDRQQIWVAPSYDITDTNEDIYTAWEYFLTYDADKILIAIDVKKRYTLPYVNDDGYWNIYGADTDIYARGRDAGQPALVMTYTDTTTSTHTVLSTLNREALSYTLDWATVEYQVRPLDTSSMIGDLSYHMMTAYMPVLPSYLDENHENLLTFLRSAIIMNVASVTSEIGTCADGTRLDDSNQLGEGSTITTFWALEQNPVTMDWEFAYVKQPGTNWAIDFNYLTDAEAIVKYYMAMGLEPDRYHFSWLVYDGVTASLKNQAEPASRSRAYPVLMNRRIDSLSDIFFMEGEDMYRNNANFVPAFHTGVTHTQSYISAVDPGNEMKFLYLENSYLPSENFKPSVIRALGVGGSDSQNLTYDFYPNTLSSNSTQFMTSLLPVWDWKEMLLRNVNTLNRYNIMSTSEDGRIFYSYIGTSYEDIDKSVLHIGTGTTNISLGLQTLTTDAVRSQMSRKAKVDVDFDTIALNGDVLKTYGWWEVTKDDEGHQLYQRSIGVNTLSYIPELSYIEEGKDYRMFVINREIMPGIEDIGYGYSLLPKTIKTAYLNVTRAIKDEIHIDGFTRLAKITGDQSRLSYILDDEGLKVYILRLASDVDDDSETGLGYTNVASRMSLSYMTYDGKCYVNIQELTDGSSTNDGALYGGEL